MNKQYRKQGPENTVTSFPLPLPPQ